MVCLENSFIIKVKTIANILLYFNAKYEYLDYKRLFFGKFNN